MSFFPLNAIVLNSDLRLESSNGSASRFIKLMLLVCLTVTISACGGKKKSGGIDQNLAQQQVKDLYDKGKAALDRGNYAFAIEYYRALEANYPYGELTEQAKLDMLFAFDKTNQIEQAVEAADNFIKLYPTHKNVDYAYYMKGVASFEKKSGRIDKFIKGGKKTIRDPKPYRDSQNVLLEGTVVTQSPQASGLKWIGS